MAKTYSSFTGSDYVLICNGKVYGDMLTCRVNSINKTIEMDLEVFNFMPNTELELRSINNGRIVEALVNDYDNKIFKTYTGVKYKGYKSNRSVNNVVITNTFIFNYESDTPFSNLEGLFTDFIKEEREKTENEHNKS